MSLAAVLAGEQPWHIEQGDVRAVLRQLPEESVHCIITSPPYWQLRDYGIPGQLGLEPTLEEYLANMVEVFREVRRVLRVDGTCWVNMGDSYAGNPPGNDRPDHSHGTYTGTRGEQGFTGAARRAARVMGKRALGNLKPKDLVGQPWRLAFALQADGWWLRSDIIWHKPNAMPESITDRPAKEHEYVFLLTKSARYFYDAEAIAEPVTGNAHPRGKGTTKKGALAWPGIGPKHAGERDRGEKYEPMTPRVRPRQNNDFQAATNELVTIRNKRTVWSIPTQPFPEAHFATYPEALVEPCLRAGTSEKGCCALCGAPIARVVEKKGGTTGKSWHDHSNDAEDGNSRIDYGSLATAGEEPYTRTTVGWAPSCECDGGGRVVPAVVLDPFAGSGTTGLVAMKHNRRFVGAELNAEYLALAQRRLAPWKGQARLSAWGDGP